MMAYEMLAQHLPFENSILAVLKASELQKQVDAMAKELRQIDNLLQETNWKTKLIEK